MSEDDHGYWIDATTMGSKYEVQINGRTGAIRWRPITLIKPLQPGKMSFDANDYAMDLEWRLGAPPPS